MTITVAPWLRERVERAAEADGRTRSVYVHRVLERHFGEIDARASESVADERRGG